MRAFLNCKMGLALVIILLAAISRIVAYIWNFTPIAAMALFGAAYGMSPHVEDDELTSLSNSCVGKEDGDYWLQLSEY